MRLFSPKTAARPRTLRERGNDHLTLMDIQMPVLDGPESTRVKSIRVAGRDGARVTVLLEDGEELTLGTERFFATGLATGDPVDAQLRARLQESATRWTIREAALRLLSHRARSRRELEERLRKKDFPSRLVRETADELVERGYLDDAAFARAFISDRLRLRPRGRRALLAELRRKGVAAKVAEPALDEVFEQEEVSELEIAVELARGWIRRQPAALGQALLSRDRTPDAQKAQRRYQGFMGRRGIGTGAAFQALDRLRQEP